MEILAKDIDVAQKKEEIQSLIEQKIHVGTLMENTPKEDTQLHSFKCILVEEVLSFIKKYGGKMITYL